jgi:hypothetical protein
VEANARRTDLRPNSAYLIWSIRKPQSSEVSGPRIRGVATSTQLMSLLLGTVLNHD